MFFYEVKNTKKNKLFSLKLNVLFVFSRICLWACIPVKLHFHFEITTIKLNIVGDICEEVYNDIGANL